VAAQLMASRVVLSSTELVSYGCSLYIIMFFGNVVSGKKQDQLCLMSLNLVLLFHPCFFVTWKQNITGMF
jgi:hypothetical protein